MGKGDSEAARVNAGLGPTIFLMAYLRMHVALGVPGLVETEKEAIFLASSLLQNTYVYDDGSAAFDIMYTGVAARAMLTTTAAWQQHIDRTQGTGKLIEPEIWSQWLYKWGIIPADS